MQSKKPPRQWQAIPDTHKQGTQPAQSRTQAIRAKVATSNIRGSLAKLACNAISDEEDCDLDKVGISES
jgi:hypothetical protein